MNTDNQVLETQHLILVHNRRELEAERELIEERKEKNNRNLKAIEDYFADISACKKYQNADDKVTDSWINNLSNSYGAQMRSEILQAKNRAEFNLARLELASGRLDQELTQLEQDEADFVEYKNSFKPKMRMTA